MPAESRGHRIAVLSGGNSSEREVSLKSGAAVEMALRSLGHRVLSIDPSQASLSDTHVNGVAWDSIDLAFLALHGASGEDGTIQTQLESLGVPYTGSGPRASQVAFSKLASKQVFLRAGVPTPPWQVVEPRLSQSELTGVARQLGFPLVVKPDQQGSSLGVSLVHDESELRAALDLAFSFGPVVLLEQAIVGEEWTVGLLDDHPLPPIRISSQGTIFDYQAKYHSDDTQYIFDDSASGVAARTALVTRHACLALGTRGVARADLMVDRLGRPFVLEVNTIPGFTDHSLVPKAAARLGMSFEDLCQWCVDSALAHFQLRRAA